MSTARAETLVVIPAWNEEEALGRVIDEVRAALPGADVLVVDDGSLDRTQVVARAHGAWVCQLPYHIGIGSAMRAGFRFAAYHGYQVVVQIDGDGQHDPAEAPRLIAALDDADVVVGSRFEHLGDYEVRGLRRLAMRVLARAISRLAGTRLSDVTSGYRAAGPAAIAMFARIYPVEYLGDTVESLAIAARTGLRISQVPVAMRAREGGHASTRPMLAAVFAFRVLAAVMLVGIRRWRPTSDLSGDLAPPAWPRHTAEPDVGAERDRNHGGDQT